MTENHTLRKIEAAEDFTKIYDIIDKVNYVFQNCPAGNFSFDRSIKIELYHIAVYTVVNAALISVVHKIC